MSTSGHGWFKFYPQDWLSDDKLRLCDAASRGVWMDLICLMAKSGGFLKVNNVRAELRQIARILQTSERQIARCLEILKHNGVASETNDGVIYCQRMVKDFQASEAGRDGAERRWKGKNPNGSPNGSDHGPPTKNPYAKKQKQKQEAESPPYPPSPGGSGGKPPDGGGAHSGVVDGMGGRTGSRPNGSVPRFRSGAIQLVYEEGLAAKAQEDLSAEVRQFLATKGLRYGND